MDEIRKIRAEQQVADALNTRNGPVVNHLHDLPLDSDVLVWREGNAGYTGSWTGPFKLLGIQGETCKINLPSGPTEFRSTTVKPYLTEQESDNVARQDSSLLPAHGLSAAQASPTPALPVLAPLPAPPTSAPLTPVLHPKRFIAYAVIERRRITPVVIPTEGKTTGGRSAIGRHAAGRYTAFQQFSLLSIFRVNDLGSKDNDIVSCISVGHTSSGADDTSNFGANAAKMVAALTASTTVDTNAL